MTDWNALSKLWDTASTDEKKTDTIPEGEYATYVKTARIDESKEIPKVVIAFQITDEGPQKNRILFANYTFSEKGIPFLKSDIRKMGLEVGEPKDLQTEIEYLVGKKVKVATKHREYNGKVYNSVFVRSLIDSAEFDKDEEIPF